MWPLRRNKTNSGCAATHTATRATGGAPIVALSFWYARGMNDNAYIIAAAFALAAGIALASSLAIIWGLAAVRDRSPARACFESVGVFGATLAVAVAIIRAVGIFGGWI